MLIIIEFDEINGQYCDFDIEITILLYHLFINDQYLFQTMNL